MIVQRGLSEHFHIETMDESDPAIRRILETEHRQSNKVYDGASGAFVRAGSS
jgi:hypothetical protein